MRHSSKGPLYATVALASCLTGCLFSETPRRFRNQSEDRAVADITAPTVDLVAPASGATVAGSLPVTAEASDDIAVVGVQFLVDGVVAGAEDTNEPWTTSLDTTRLADGAHALVARARDAAGNVATSGGLTVTVANGTPGTAPPDTAAPTVALTTPTSGATVAGSVAVSATATDNVGVAGVQFLVDGVATGTEDTAAPYARTLDTTAWSNGPHTLTARARDAAGNTATSAVIDVTLSNVPVTPPPIPTRDQVAQACASAPLVATRVVYVCDCGAGSDPNCQQGSDANSGADTAHPFETFARAMQAFNSLAGGEAVVLCKGGAFDIPSNAYFFNPSCSAASPCLMREYTPPWASGDEAAPRLSAAGGDSVALAFEDPNLANGDGGYTLHNLELRGQGGGIGVQFYNDVNDVDFCNLEVHEFSVAFNSAGANAPDTTGQEGPVGDDDELNSRIRLRGSWVHHNRQQGWLGAGNDVEVEANFFDYNGLDSTMFVHSIYIGGVGARVRVVGNVVQHPSQAIGGSCNGTPIVAHGQQSDLLIEGNVVRLEPGVAAQGCWGLTVSAAYGASWGQEFNDRVIVRRNRVYNAGGLSLGVSNCRDCIVESNLIVQSSASMAGTGIAAPDRAPSGEDAPLDRLTVRSNTIVLASSGSTATGIAVGSQGSGHVVANNVIISTAAGPLDCLGLTLAASAYASDYNVCYAQGGGALAWNQGGASLASFQGAGRDVHSQTINPLLVVGADEDYRPGDASPLIGAADPATSAQTELDGDARGADPDIGASEW